MPSAEFQKDKIRGLPVSQYYRRCFLSTVYHFLFELCGFIMIERGDIVEDEKCTVNSETQMHLSP